MVADYSQFDAIIVIGVVIAGDTNHHEIIGDSTAQALVELSIAKKVPVINGILVVNNLAQAEARAGERNQPWQRICPSSSRNGAIYKKMEDEQKPVKRPPQRREKPYVCGAISLPVGA